MSIFTKRFPDFWLIDDIYNACFAIENAKPYVYFSKVIKKWLYSMLYGLRNNQKTSVRVAFIAGRLRKPFAPIADFEFKCCDTLIGFYKNIIRYSKAGHGKLRTANAGHIVLRKPVFEKFILKQDFRSFAPNFRWQIFARIRRVKRNIFNLVLQHIGKYTNFIDLDLEAWGRLHRNTSRPFQKPETGNEHQL